MAELIGADDHPVEINSLFTASNPVVSDVESAASALPSPGSLRSSDAPYRETLPAFEPPVRMEPAATDAEGFEFAEPEHVSQASPGGFELSNEAAELADDEVSPESNLFKSDQFEHIDDPSDFDSFQADFDQDERVPVTGPVAPRPLSAVASRDFGDKAISAQPRKKKKSSPVKSGIKMILGGVVGLALGGAVLELLGRPMFWPFDGTLTRNI